jgi:flagellin
MSLGVLNNLAALSSANNLNNTSNSLSNVLQQLSSGSRINSGADDPAGLSLVNGLQANSMALAQSKTNASQGVGLLKVADGALSQVTNLLNRAVTLATEVSNGTLNGSQQAAANQEYQSILSEIDNIGSTTTYNQKQVFGSDTSIYVGDSSSAGASIDKLSVSALSSASVGDTNGKMSYSNGQDNVFLNLSTLGKTAALTDTLSAGGASSIDVNYLTTGANGSAVTAKATISVGTGSNYSNTVGGLINAINDSGLGISATFTTAANAGSVANAGTINPGGIDTGIQITGANIGTGTSAGVIGTIKSVKAATPAATLAADTLAGTVTIAGNSVNLATGNTGGTAFSMNSLATFINQQGWGVTASVDVGTANQATLTLSSSNGDTTANLVSASDAAATTTTGSNTPTSSYVKFAVSASIGDTGTTASAITGVVDNNGSGGTATIGYSASAGQNLSSTDLTSSTNAQRSLNALNSAIAAVAAQDGYIGAQINTLNAVSSVLSTQQQNVIAAQNAVQATDYASAASEMSKYQILSQTGIAALSQANSMQQEVTKLLQ